MGNTRTLVTSLGRLRGLFLKDGRWDYPRYVTRILLPEGSMGSQVGQADPVLVEDVMSVRKARSNTSSAQYKNAPAAFASQTTDTFQSQMHKANAERLLKSKQTFLSKGILSNSKKAAVIAEISLMVLDDVLDGDVGGGKNGMGIFQEHNPVFSPMSAPMEKETMTPEIRKAVLKIMKPPTSSEFKHLAEAKRTRMLASTLQQRTFRSSHLDLHHGNKVYIPSRCYSTGSAPYMVVVVPDLTSSLNEGTNIKWKKKVGDKVDVGEIVCEIYSPSFTLKLESVKSGYLAKILTSEGPVEIQTGMPIAIMVDNPDDVETVCSAISSEAIRISPAVYLHFWDHRCGTKNANTEYLKRIAFATEGIFGVLVGAKNLVPKTKGAEGGFDPEVLIRDVQVAIAISFPGNQSVLVAGSLLYLLNSKNMHKLSEAIVEEGPWYYRVYVPVAVLHLREGITRKVQKMRAFALVAFHSVALRYALGYGFLGGAFFVLYHLVEWYNGIL